MGILCVDGCTALCKPHYPRHVACRAQVSAGAEKRAEKISEEGQKKAAAASKAAAAKAKSLEKEADRLSK